MGGVEPRRPVRTAGRVAITLLAALFAVIGTQLPAAADPQVAFTIKDNRITESSGLAADPDRDLYWTVNDSGDGGRVFALDDSGDVTGTLNFRARPDDVEAVQYHDGSLYVADIGDNDGERQFVTVYVLFDPQPDNRTVLYHAYDFAYPDGPHDAETLLVGDSGEIFIVTKEKHGAIYRAPAEASRQSVNQLTRIGDAPPYVTDGTFLTDGRIALRSYVDVKIVDPGKDYAVVGQASTPFQPQGESVTTDLGGDALLVGSEGEDSAVYRMDVPRALDDVPSAGAEPPSTSPTPEPSARTSSPAAPAESGNRNDSGTPGRGGTFAAMMIAAGVAVVAGVAVYLVRGRRTG